MVKSGIYKKISVESWDFLVLYLISGFSGYFAVNWKIWHHTLGEERGHHDLSFQSCLSFDVNYCSNCSNKHQLIGKKKEADCYSKVYLLFHNRDSLLEANVKVREARILSGELEL